MNIFAYCSMFVAHRKCAIDVVYVVVVCRCGWGMGQETGRAPKVLFDAVRCLEVWDVAVDDDAERFLSKTRLT